jgi:hypothetical protein
MNKQLLNHIWLVGIIIFNLPVGASLAVDRPPPVIEMCKGQPHCNFLGNEKGWPEQGFDSEYVTFTNRIFDVRLPRTMDKVSIGWGDSPLYALWFSDKRVAFGIEDVPDEIASADYAEILEEKKQSDWVGIDIFKIMFNNTSSEKEPNNAYERYLWRTAFFHKVIVYGGIKSALIYKRGPWSAYSAVIDGPVNRRLTVVTHREIKDQYLSIQDNGFDQEFIEKVIASVSLNNKQ